ncbi:hypothetical protein BKA69DRAFT_916636 [Paraphysoderma sedebokerense]|nr:hypothetical protein BKA69DRAFT_916636 [Paraphysoderma sedebokerense]
MLQMRGGTDILAGLQLCAQAFTHSSLPNNGKQLWIFTDGVYTGGDPTPFARELQRQGVLITAIGIGYGITQETLENVASYGRAFWKEDFDKAVEFISSGITPNLQQELTHLQVFLENSMNKIGYDVSFLLEITNNTEQSIPSQSCVYIPQTQYFNARRIILPREIHPYQKWQTPFVLECKNSNIKNKFHDWILKLPQIIEIYLCDSTGNWIPTNENGFELSIGKCLAWSRGSKVKIA